MIPVVPIAAATILVVPIAATIRVVLIAVAVFAPAMRCHYESPFFNQFQKAKAILEYI